MNVRAKPLTTADGELRSDLTDQELSRFRPAAEVLPASLRAKLGVRGPQRAPTKERTTIRFSPSVLARLKAGGPGWQTRVDQALAMVLGESPDIDAVRAVLEAGGKRAAAPARRPAKAVKASAAGARKRRAGGGSAAG